MELLDIPRKIFEEFAVNIVDFTQDEDEMIRQALGGDLPGIGNIEFLVWGSSLNPGVEVSETIVRISVPGLKRYGGTIEASVNAIAVSPELPTGLYTWSDNWEEVGLEVILPYIEASTMLFRRAAELAKELEVVDG